MSLPGRSARIAALALSTLILAAGLAACGGDDDSSQLTSQESAEAKAVLAVGAELKQGYENGDAQAICGLLERESLKKQFGGSRNCVKKLNAAFAQTEEVPDFSFDNITVDGDTAVATADTGDGGTGNTIHFTKVNGEWLVDISPRSGGAETGSGQGGKGR